MQPSNAPASPACATSPLPSFLIAGFEGADHRNSSGRPVAMLDATGHATSYAQNYARLRGVGVRAIRESIGWSRAERGGRFDFGCALRRAEAARKAGLGVIWTFWHYGIPDDVDLFDERLPDRFAAFAHAAASALHDASIAAPIFCPVNEISFLAWAACESTLIHPHRGAPGHAASRRGFELKKRLVRAALAGCDAIRAAIPGAQMLHVDPLVHIVAPAADPSLEQEAARTRTFQFQAWDMLAGRLCPELGGAAHHLDYVGVNYYHGNQFEMGTERRLHWHLRDRRRVPFRALLHETFARYGRPLLIAETSHFGVGRDRWLLEIAREVRGAMREGVDVAGLCLYPIIDRPDWERPSHWHHSGLWDRSVADDGMHFERLHLPSLRAVRYAQHTLGDDARGHRADHPPCYALVVFAAGRWSAVASSHRASIEALARDWTIVVVEGDDRSARRAQPPRAPGIVVLTPTLGAGEDDAHDAGAASLVGELLTVLTSLGIGEYGVWAHTPTALPIMMHLSPDVVAYTPGASPNARRNGDPRSAAYHDALCRMADVVGDVSRPALERARRLPRRRAAQAMLTDARERCKTPRRESSSDCPLGAQCVVVGAGLAGLCTAWHYGAGSLLLERDVTPGGSRRSVADHGFLFDLAGHVLDGRDSFDALYRRALAGNVVWHAPRVVAHRDERRRASSLAPYFAAFDAHREPIGYPQRGGTQALIDGLVPLLEGAFIRGTEVIRILPREHCVELDDRRRVRYERLIVTLPLPTLLALCDDAVPVDVAEAASRLRTLSLRSVNIGVRGVAPVDADWLLDTGEAIFDRVFLHGNVALSGNRAGRFALVCEIVHSASRPLTLHGSALVRRCVDDCIAAGLVGSREAVIVTHETDFPIAAVIDDAPRAANLRQVERWLDGQGIGFTGSRGDWELGRCAMLMTSAREAARAAHRAVACKYPANAAR